jgi:hypothetical protein
LLNASTDPLRPTGKLSDLRDGFDSHFEPDSPDLYAAQAELLRTVEAHQSGTGDKRFALTNLEAARTKLRLLGILPEQIAEIERTRKETTHLTIYAPFGGTVIEKNVGVGQKKPNSAIVLTAERSATFGKFSSSARLISRSGDK